MCIGCAITNHPEEYTRRQKLIHKKKVMKVLIGSFELLLNRNKPERSTNG